MLGNVNQNTPYGSLSYDRTGSYSFTDPYTGHTYDVPTFTATQTLNPQQQATQDRLSAAQGNLASIAENRSDFLKDYLSQGVDTSNVPGLVSSAGLNKNFSSDLGRDYKTKFNTNVGGGYDTAFARGVGDGYDTAFSGDIGGGYDTAFGRDIGNGYNSIFGQKLGANYNTAFNSDVGGSYTDKLGPGYQTGVDLATTYAGADDFSADRQRYEDALWQRGASDRAASDEALRTKLINSGLREGSAAWNAEMERQARQNTDARLATFLAGGEEQSRMVNLARDAAVFGNQSTLAQAQFGNDALSNQFQLQNEAALNRAQFGSQQQQLSNQASLNKGIFDRDTQLAQNQAALGLAQYGREGQLAQNAAALNQAQFGQNAQLAQNASVMGLAQYGSQQQQAQNAAALAQAQFGSSQQQAGNAASLARAQFGSQQQQASNAAALADAQFQNAARAQGLQEAYAGRSQPINEIIGLMSGSQVQQPNFVNANMPTIPTTDNAALINQNYNQQLAAWQANQGVLGGIMGGIGSLIGLSDDDAKKDKKRLGDVDGKMGLWAFRYKGEPGTQPKHIGLMASEVEKVKPSAVMRGRDGLRRVDYGRALGLMGV